MNAFEGAIAPPALGRFPRLSKALLPCQVLKNRQDLPKSEKGTGPAPPRQQSGGPEWFSLSTVVVTSMSDTDSLLKKKARVLTELYGWSVAYAQAYIEGEDRHKRAEPLGADVAAVGDHALGFRDGYSASQIAAATQDQTTDAPKTE